MVSSFFLSSASISARFFSASARALRLHYGDTVTLRSFADQKITSVELLGAAPRDCVLLDDSVRSCRAAREAGLTVIGVYDPFFAATQGEMPAACHRFIHSFAELLEHPAAL